MFQKSSMTNQNINKRNYKPSKKIPTLNCGSAAGTEYVRRYISRT